MQLILIFFSFFLYITDYQAVQDQVKDKTLRSFTGDFPPDSYFPSPSGLESDLINHTSPLLLDSDSSSLSCSQLYHEKQSYIFPKS